MSVVPASALVDVEHLISRLASLTKHHQAAGRITHAKGVHSAFDLATRNLADAKKARQLAADGM